MSVFGNQAILSEINSAQSWFQAKKSKAIWARQATENHQLTTLEGRETVELGDFLCRGEIGEIWPQSADSLLGKYIPTDTVNDDGWRKYTPNPDHEGVMAATVSHPFTIETSWGTMTGKEGDYLVKNYCDKDAAYPGDVWIVDRQIFNATYQES